MQFRFNLDVFLPLSTIFSLSSELFLQRGIFCFSFICTLFCHTYFLDRGLQATQSRVSIWLSRNHHHDLFNRYGVPVSQITTNVFRFSYSQSDPSLIQQLSPVYNKSNTTGFHRNCSPFRSI